MNRRGIVIGAAMLALVIVAIGWWLATGATRSVAATSGPEQERGPALIGVVATQPTYKPFAQEVEALGTVRANESVDITAKVADRVAAIRFAEGQQVRKGSVLVELDSDEALADLAAAKAAASDSRSQYKRSQELFQTRALSEAQLDQLQATLLANEARVAAAQSRVDDRIIIAPFSGRVGLRHVSLGGLVNPGAVITTLDDLSVVKLDFSVPEVFLSILKPGLTIEARSGAYPGATFVGKVGSIDTRIESSTRSVAIRALIDNQDARLRPGMFMTVRLMRSEGDALMLPEQAIVPESDQHFVFVIEDGRARKKSVTLGRRRPGEVEILEGVTAEDMVVTDGTVKLSDGVMVRVQNDVALVAGPRDKPT